jgi:hypothetical protein
MTTNKCGASTPTGTSSGRFLPPFRKPSNTSSCADYKDLPDEETVWSLLELAGWEYKRMDFKGQLFSHRLRTPEGFEYMVPITAGVPPFVEVWWMFNQLTQS